VSGPTRADTWDVTVQVEDVRHPNRIMLNLGTWDKRGGGQVDSEEYKYPPGAMQQTVSLGGRKNTDNVTVSRLYRLVRDHSNLVQKLINGAGKARMTVSQQPLDVNGNAFGQPIVWRGTLKRVTPPEHDSESSDAALIELEMTVEGEPVVG
jgi:hypothetical protein